MGFIKCPRCELNYIRDTEHFCSVCLREMKGDEQEETIEMCSICGENPVMPGKDVCQTCYKEMNHQQGIEADDTTADKDEVQASIELDDVTDMEEIEIDTLDDGDDVPQELKVSLEEEQSREQEEAEREDREDEEEY